jgi:Aspartyl protease
VMSLDLNVLPGGLFTVPVMLNGSPRQLLFSNAGGRSALTRSAAESLGLHVNTGGFKLLADNGNVSRAYVTLDSFVMGGVEAKDMKMMISPLAKIGNTGTDGTLADDIMIAYDEEMDFANKKVLYFLPDHCEGDVVHWTNLSSAVMPFRRSLPGSNMTYDTHIRFDVMLDGKDVLALLSTGTPRTRISARVANAEFDVNENTPGTVPMGELAGRKVVSYAFKTISFGNISVSNPQIVVLPDVIGLNDPNNDFRTDDRSKRVDDDIGADMIIGMDVLKKLHIYVATKEQNLYVTAAGDHGS